MIFSSISLARIVLLRSLLDHQPVFQPRHEHEQLEVESARRDLDEAHDRRRHAQHARMAERRLAQQRPP